MCHNANHECDQQHDVHGIEHSNIDVYNKTATNNDHCGTKVLHRLFRIIIGAVPHR